MSRYNKWGRLRAKHNPAYRDPKFMMGLCCVCRKRQRRYTHEHYPHMCDACRRSRVMGEELGNTDQDVARSAIESSYGAEVARAPSRYDASVAAPVLKDAPTSNAQLRGQQLDNIKHTQIRYSTKKGIIKRMYEDGDLTAEQAKEWLTLAMQHSPDYKPTE